VAVQKANRAIEESAAAIFTWGKGSDGFEL
jgi:hypothetical protein